MALAGWNENNKIILTIDNTNVDEDLTDFPVLVTLSSSTGINNFDATDVFDELTYGREDPTYVKLLLHMDDTGLSDSSDYIHNTTLNGTTTRSSTQSKFGGYSAYFPGNTSSYLSVPDSDDWYFGSGNFTIDFWIRSDGSFGDNGICGTSEGGGATKKWGIYLDSISGGSLTFHRNSNTLGTFNVNWAWSPSDNTWYHVAIVRSSSNWYLFVNGVQTGGTQTQAGVIENVSSDLRIGADGEGWKGFKGWVDEFRISNGIALWGAGFTPSTAAYTADTSTKLLVHLDNDLVDASATHHSLSDNGVTFSSSVKKFGTHSVVMTPSTYINIPNHADFAFGTGDFTVDFWLNLTSITGVNVMFFWYTESGGEVALQYQNMSALYVYLNNVVQTATPYTSVAGVWVHMAMVVENNIAKLYSNGQEFFDGNMVAGSCSPNSNGIYIGFNDGTYGFNGFIDEFRISNTAVWSANFTPPISPYVDAWYGRKQIAVTDSDENPLFVEIENLDWDNEIMSLWVKVPTVSSGTDTVLYLYYDATVSENTTYVGDTGDIAAQSVWDSNFKAVYHMAQDPSGGVGAIKDSTSNINHGTSVGSMTTGDLVDGKIGKAIDFDGSDDYIDVPFSMVMGSPSLEATFEFVAEGYGQALMGTERSTSYTGDSMVYNNSNGTLTYYIDNLTAPPYVETITSTATATTTEFNYYALSTNITSNNYLLTVNSVTEQIYKSFLTGQAAHADVVIARHRNYTWSTGYYHGVIGEIRISDIPRTAPWLKATYYSMWDDFISFVNYVSPVPPQPPIVGVANIWAINNFVFKTMISGIGVYNVSSESLLGLISYTPGYAGSVWANNDYLYISTTNSGVLMSPISSISGAVYDDLSIYKTYPDISSEYVNYVHGAGNYLNVATISGAYIFDLTTGSGLYTDLDMVAYKCYQLANRTAYYIYDDKLETVYNDDSTYVYSAGDGIIPTISEMNDLHVVSGTNNLILLATTNGAVAIEESKGNEPNSRFKYYYIEE